MERNAMNFKVNPLLPCLSFFTAGRVMPGLLNLCLQLTVVLWPAAVAMARRYTEATATERLLNEFAQSYQVPVRYDVKPRKRFRTYDVSDAEWGLVPFGGVSSRLAIAN